MKLPGILGSLLNKKNDRKEVFVSLYLDIHRVSAAAWILGDGGVPQVAAGARFTLAKDTWEDRIDAVDRALAALEDKTGRSDLVKTILGLPPEYLTESGNIHKDVRTQIKELAKTLELTPIGFVPVHQAVVYKLKKDEGVPPSVILLGLNHESATLTLYKIGALVGIRVIEKGKDILKSLEAGLKSFTELEVLPARIILYGGQASELEQLKADLLKHPWPTRVNFLHFPKIETLSDETALESISLAGASEIAGDVDGSLEESGEEQNSEPIPTAPAQMPKPEKTYAGASEGTSGEFDDEEEITAEAAPDEVAHEIAEAQEVIEEDLTPSHKSTEDANVVMVPPETLGFRKHVDVLEEKAQKEKLAQESYEDEEELEEQEMGAGGFSFAQRLSSIKLPTAWIARLPKRMGGKKGAVIAVVIVILILCSVLAMWVLPHATVTILTVPHEISESMAILIDSTATIADAQSKTIPGKTQEKTISGEKSIPVLGKKKIGDPAKGTVTIYNKALSSRSLKKGAVLVSGSLQFTLDGDVQIASASESVGSITFGKADAAVTAAAIGPQSNLPAGSEFTFKDLSSSVATARNEKAFTGGTSREVTVVTRDDYDRFEEEMTEELVQKAQEELAASVGGGEQLIEGTIETDVTERVFVQELDQETDQLDGKLTLSVTGISYSQDDVKNFLASVVAPSVPSGYSLSPDRTTVEIRDVKVQKNGKITATATIEAVAAPQLEIAAIGQALRGKKLADAQEYLKTIPGVAGMEVGFRFSLSRDRLPLNKNNISVSVVIR